MKEQYDTLVEWRKREQEKFDQTKAVITALKEENQELQVKNMTLQDKMVRPNPDFLHDFHMHSCLTKIIV